MKGIKRPRDDDDGNDESEEENDDEEDEKDEDESDDEDDDKKSTKTSVQSTGAKSRYNAEIKKQDERRNRAFASEEGVIYSELLNALIVSIDKSKIEVLMKLKKKKHPEDFKFLSDCLANKNTVVYKCFFFFFFFLILFNSNVSIEDGKRRRNPFQIRPSG